MLLFCHYKATFSDWNADNSAVTSFPAPSSNKWNAPYVCTAMVAQMYVATVWLHGDMHESNCCVLAFTIRKVSTIFDQ